MFRPSFSRDVARADIQLGIFVSSRHSLRVLHWRAPSAPRGLCLASRRLGFFASAFLFARGAVVPRWRLALAVPRVLWRAHRSAWSYACLDFRLGRLRGGSLDDMVLRVWPVYKGWFKISFCSWLLSAARGWWC